MKNTKSIFVVEIGGIPQNGSCNVEIEGCYDWIEDIEDETRIDRTVEVTEYVKK